MRYKKIIVLILFVAAASVQNAVSQYDTRSMVSAFSATPEIPATYEWAGETVVLDRFDIRERFDRELTGFCFNHTNTLLVIKRANRYFPILKPILDEMGVPEDFLYLAVIESYLNPRAVSPAKAAGMWQIMPSTGKSLGLEVSDYVDERYHLIKATRAACKYLKSAYKRYGSWITAAASYNAGQGRISTELDKQVQEHAFDLWLNDETSRYIFRLMAMKAVMKDPLKYGFVIRKNQLYPQIRFDEVEVTEEIPDLSAFANEHCISYSQLKEFNSWLRDRKLPVKEGNSYILLIPRVGDLYYSSNEQPVYYDKWTID